jgi:hypothetical protein
MDSGMSMEVEQTRHNGVEVWTVPLPDHEPYAFIRLKRVFSSPDARHRVVIVDANKLLACSDRDTTDYALPLPQYWHSGKLRGIREFLDPKNARIPEMPYVTFKTRQPRTLRSLIGLTREGVVSFRNGQHRARYMAYAGAVAFPVEVHETEADLLQRYCGAR